MENSTTILLILVFAVMGLVFFVLLMALVRETLFWYWRTKGMAHAPRDIMNRGHETAILIKKNIEVLKAAEKKAAPSTLASPETAGVGDSA
jgi:hypothetical protein